MVGKITRVRQKLHQEAVKLQRPESRTQRPAAGTCPRLPEPPAGELRPGEPPAAETTGRCPKEPPQQARQSSFPSRIFAGTKISPEALVQKLNYEEPPGVPLSPKKGPEQRKLKTKRVKLNEKRERWKQKMISIRQSRVQQAAAARRKATPVVGDMRPLADALPELCQLVALAEALTSRRKSRKDRVPAKKPEPTDFSQMNQSQKQKLLESESSRFHQAVKTLSSKKNPLADIGEQLRKRMKQEEEEGPG